MTILDRPTQPGRPDTARSATEGRHQWRYVPALIGVLVCLVTYIGAGIASYWGDEAASVLSAQRPWPSLVRELGRVDAVHGLYYSTLHLWIDVFGSSEWSTRALSCIGLGFLSAGLVLLGRTWFSQRTGIVAGVLIAFIPRASALGIEARGYALAAAATVWLTILFLRLVRRGSSVWWWLLYGVLLAVTGTLFMYSLLIAGVHLVSLLGRKLAAGQLRRILTGFSLAALLSLPVVVLAEREKHQIAFLAHRNYVTFAGVFGAPWFLSGLPAVFFWALILFGVVTGMRQWRRTHLASGFLPTVTWLVLTPCFLILMDRFVSPTYNPRYLSCCLGAVALLAAQGIWAVVDGIRRIHAPQGVVAVAACAALVTGFAVIPSYLELRTPFAKDGGADFRQVAQQVSKAARPGDTVLFGNPHRPSRNPRLAADLYPKDFRGLNQPQLLVKYADTDGIWDRLSPVSRIALKPHGTVWLLEWNRHGSAVSDITALRRAGFTEVSHKLVHRTTIHEFRKDA